MSFAFLWMTWWFEKFVKFVKKYIFRMDGGVNEANLLQHKDASKNFVYPDYNKVNPLKANTGPSRTSVSNEDY